MSINWRIKEFKNKDGSTRKYLYLVENTRENGKPKQKNLACLGRVDKENNDEFVKIAKGLGAILNDVYVLSKEDLGTDLDADWSKIYGPICVFRKLWKRFGIDKILDRYAKIHNYKFDVSEAVFSMVCNHLMEPASDKRTITWKDSIYEPKWEGLELQHYYRALDFLIEHKDKIEKKIFKNVAEQTTEDLELVLFDTTTVTYYGEGENTNLLKHGHSKDKRNDLKQIMIGLIMTKNGYPLSHEVFRGNLGDINAFRVILEKLKKQFGLKRIVLVCDRGMISKKNIQLLDELGYEYILGVRMRQLDEEMRKKLLAKENFKVIKSGKLWVKEVVIDDVKYIINYNPETAYEEAQKREYFKEIIAKKVETNTIKEWIIKNGYKKYISITGAKITLDEKKLEEEAIYDGTWILKTNTRFTAKEIALYYKDLWQIECCFRDLKSELEVGPIYHRVDDRIRSHVFVKFLALILKTTFKKSIKHIDPEASYSDILSALKQVHAIQISLNNKKHIAITKVSDKAEIAFNAVGVKIPNKILEAQE